MQIFANSSVLILDKMSSGIWQAAFISSTFLKLFQTSGFVTSSKENVETKARVSESCFPLTLMTSSLQDKRMVLAKIAKNKFFIIRILGCVLLVSYLYCSNKCVKGTDVREEKQKKLYVVQHKKVLMLRNKLLIIPPRRYFFAIRRKVTTFAP